MVEVEVFQRFAGRESGRSDAGLAAMRLAFGDLTLQADVVNPGVDIKAARSPECAAGLPGRGS